MANDDSDSDSSGEGWLETKKIGRDDEQIEADKQKALLERRKRRNPNYQPKLAPAKKAKTTTKAAKKKRVYSDDEEDDEDSFIEEDSDVEEESDADEKDWNEEDEEEEDEEDELSLQENSDDEDEGTFKTYKPRSKTTSSSRQAAARNQSSRSAANGKGTRPGSRLTKQSTKKPIEVLSSGDSDSDNSNDSASVRGETMPHNGKRSNASLLGAAANSTARKKDITSIHDDSDDSDAIPSASKLGRPPQPKSVVPDARMYDSDDSDRKPSASAYAKSQPTAGAKQKTWSDGDLSSPSPIMNRQRKKNGKKHSNNQKSHYFQEDDDESALSEAEAVAIALAISESETNTQENGTKKAADNTHDEIKAAADETEVADLLDTDDEPEQEEEEQDEFADPEADEAVSVLETANALSKEILTTMLIWMNGGDDSLNTNPVSKSNVPMGMIVDGALALSTVSALESGESLPSQNKSWISKQTMKTICPDVDLADYQLIGVNWLALMHGMKCSVKGGKGKFTPVNGVLADEMGLGKTVQTIAFLSWLKHSNSQDQNTTTIHQNSPTVDSDDDSFEVIEDEASAPHLPHLIVVPSSVVSNWVREFETFAPHMNVVKYYGSQAEREQLQHTLRFHLRGARRLPGTKPVDVIIVPITYFSSESPNDRNFLRKFQFDYVVCDEAHLLKNARGSRYKNLDRFKSLHRLLLTGTPVQNHPSELLALLCFLMPLFSARKCNSYEEEDAKGVGESMLRHFVALEKGEAASEESAYRKLKQLFAPFVLRRKKEDVLSQLVPPKTIRVEYVELEPKARSLYDSIISNHINAKKTADYKELAPHLFTQLRKAAHHPLLIRSRHKSSLEKQQLAELFHKYQAFQGGTVEQVAAELDKFNDFEIHHTALDLVEQNPCRRESLEQYILREEDLFCSTKFVRLKSLLPELIAEGHRVLIFSVWTSCLDLLGCLLEAMGIVFLRMDGQTPVKERQDLMDRFQKDATIPVFLLSTKACGLGITLTAADRCIMHDIDFNPANDKQAEDRCHRIGQKKPVTVIKLVAQSTVDEDIYNMQERKAKMNHAIMETDEWKKESDNDKGDVLKAAIDRFLHTPSRQNGRSSEP